MAGEAANFLAGGSIPQSGGTVVTGSENIPRIWREDRRVYLVGMAGEAANLLAGRRIPQLGDLTDACQHDASIGRQRKPSWSQSGGADKLTKFPAGCDIPQPGSSVKRTCQYRSTIGRESDILHTRCVADEATDLLAGRHIPEQYRILFAACQQRCAVG